MVPWTGLSPKQQIVCVTACCFGVLWLCGTAWQAVRSPLVAVSLASSVPETVTVLIDPPVDVNRAGYEELQLLPAIGPVMAERILRYRRQHGPFASVDELARIHGIGPKTVQKLSYYLKFDD